MSNAREAARDLKRRVGAIRGREVPDGPVGPPDFIGVGTQRSGTTWWYRLICSHPSVVGGPKERHFFDRFWGRPFTAVDVEEYGSMFPVREGAVSGEWTPRYLHEFWVPPLIRRAAPDSRLIVLLRDPLERFRSGVTHETSRFLEAVTRRRRPYASSLLVSDALGRSLYGRQVENLFASVPVEQVLVLQYERCAADPAGELNRTFEFLGLEPIGRMPDGADTRAGRRRPPAELSDEVIEGARAAIRKDLQLLRTLAPDLDLDLWESARGA